jgi:hypothetical protein
MGSKTRYSKTERYCLSRLCFVMTRQVTKTIELKQPIEDKAQMIAKCYGNHKMLSWHQDAQARVAK